MACCHVKESQIFEAKISSFRKKKTAIFDRNDDFGSKIGDFRQKLDKHDHFYS